jgi:hypothetical protein
VLKETHSAVESSQARSGHTFVRLPAGQGLEGSGLCFDLSLETGLGELRQLLMSKILGGGGEGSQEKWGSLHSFELQSLGKELAPRQGKAVGTGDRFPVEKRQLCQLTLPDHFWALCQNF